MEGPRPGDVGPVVISPWEAKFHHSLNNQSLSPTQTHLLPFSLCASSEYLGSPEFILPILRGSRSRAPLSANAHVSEDGAPH